MEEEVVPEILKEDNSKILETKGQSLKRRRKGI